MSISSVSSVASATAAAQLGQQAVPASGGGSSVHGKGRHEHGELGKAQSDSLVAPNNSAAGTSGSAVNQIA